MRFGTAGPVVCYPAPTEPIAVALAQLSKAQAMCRHSLQARAAWRPCVRMCAKELEALSESHATSSVWASAGIAAVVRLCQDPAAAAAAATALSHLSSLSEQEHAANRAAIIGAGAIPPLVALLSGGPDSVVATKAARVLSNLADNDANRAAIAGAGAISLLVGLLPGGPDSEAAANAAFALASLAVDSWEFELGIHANGVAIARAGAISPLVALLSGGPESEAAANAAFALASLAMDTFHRNIPICAAITKAGAIPLLVALLSGGPESKTATYAAMALGILWDHDPHSRRTISEAGAIQPLVALLSGAFATGWLQCHVAWMVMGLDHLAQDAEGRAAIIGAGAIPPLVALLSDDLDETLTETAAFWAAGTLRSLEKNNEDMKLNKASRSTIVVAGAIPVLVALLSPTPCTQYSGASVAAAYVLSDLVLSDLVYHTAVLEELARTQTSCSPWDRLRKDMCRTASGRLVVAGVEQAITLATAVRVHAAALERAQEFQRVQELSGDAERHQARLESFGLGSLELPEEFVCPITWAKMRGVPPPPSPPRRPRTPAPRLPRLRFCRPGGGVRRPHLRALRHPLGLPRRHRPEPAHPRAASAKRAHREP